MSSNTEAIKIETYATLNAQGMFNGNLVNNENVSHKFRTIKQDIDQSSVNP